MKQIQSSFIKISVGTVSGNDAIILETDEETFFLLTAKAGSVAEKVVVQLNKPPFNVESFLGMAFDWQASFEKQRLINHPIPRAVGVYVSIANFDEVRALFLK